MSSTKRTNLDLGPFLLYLQIIATTLNFTEVLASFNFYLDRREFHKLHGISTDIYYVRDGVVNNYATSFLVTVPAEVNDLNFSWQALTKRPVLYEMTFDYTDYLALLPPVCNISKVGRVPETLQVFRLSLICTGKSNAEVFVNIRVVFQFKQNKILQANATTIHIRRNKICLFKESTSKHSLLSPGERNLARSQTHGHPSLADKSSLEEQQTVTTDMSIFENPTPALFFGALLAGSAITASTVFVTFLICLRRKVVSSQNQQTLNKRTILPQECPQSDLNSSDLLSPAYPKSETGTTTTIKNGWKGEKNYDHHPSFRPCLDYNSSSSSNFWSNIFNTEPNGETGTQKHLNSVTQHTYKGSDVSPYAYAQVGLVPPPLPKADIPQLTERCAEVQCTLGSREEAKDKSQTHVYANSDFSSFFSRGNSESLNVGEYNTGAVLPRRQSNSTVLSDNAAGSGTIIQLGGFQCSRQLVTNKSVVERFL